MVSFLTEELVAHGHDVTLFASGDSITSARLIAACPAEAGEGAAGFVSYTVLLGMLARHAHEFDLIHFHLIHWMPLPLVRATGVSSIVTFHMPVSGSDGLEPLFEEFREIPIVSLSNAQRAGVNRLNWAGTVYYGMPLNQYRLREAKGSYLAFLGRMDPCKGLQRAIEIAIAAGLPLKIAGPIRNPAEQLYFDSVVAPHLENSVIEYAGELDDAGKQALLEGACAMLFPIEWPEPFGLVLLESLACGTPVIAFDQGSVRELITDGVTGFIVKGPDEAVQAIAKLSTLSRANCRAEFERRFSSARMCGGYLQIYERVKTFRRNDAGHETHSRALAPLPR
jgi:glycosyltransferase involved in cell wall biosynthesis